MATSSAEEGSGEPAPGARAAVRWRDRSAALPDPAFSAGRKTSAALGLAGLALALAGCLTSGGGGVRGAWRTCLVENARFAEAWACIEAHAGPAQATAAHRDAFLAEGTVLADQVKSGAVTESDGRARLSAGLTREIGE